MLAQALANLGCGAGLTPDHKHNPEPLLQQLDPLRDGRGRDVEVLGRPLEAAGSNDSRKSGEVSVIEHGLATLMQAE
jgi:hypothetical protein